MKRLAGLVLFSAAIAACDAAESAPPERPASAKFTVPEPMLGCWEGYTAYGKREWLEIDPTTVRGQFSGDPAFQTSKIGPGMEAGAEGLITLKITIPAQSEKAAAEYELWMEETAVLRVGNYWGEGVAEPDPEFEKCRG